MARKSLRKFITSSLSFALAPDGSPVHAIRARYSEVFDDAGTPFQLIDDEKKTPHAIVQNSYYVMKDACLFVRWKKLERDELPIHDLPAIEHWRHEHRHTTTF